MGTASQRTKTTHSRHPASVAPPAFVAGTGTGGAWWNSADTVGGTHGGVGPSTDDDVLPGFGGSEAPGLGSGGGGFGGGSGSWAYFKLQTLGVVRMAYRCHLPLRWMANGRVAGSLG